MKRFAVIFIIGLLLTGGQLMAAEVTNVELSYQEGAVVARIDVQGQIRFTHETEVPKNGRPDRVIIDILSATHELGGKEFLELPRCVIQSIRSSQFAVTPEKIVRVVFDLQKSPVYKVDVKDNAIFIYFTDQEARSFARWSTSQVHPADEQTKAPAVAAAPKSAEPKPVASTPTAAQKNKAIESDRMASLKSGSKAPKATPVAKSSPAPAREKAEPAGFNQLLAKTEPAPVTENKKPVAEKPAPVQKAPVKASSGADSKVDAKSEPAPTAKPEVTPKKSSDDKAGKELVPSSVPKSASSKNLASVESSTPKAKPTVAKKVETSTPAPSKKAPVTVAKKTEKAPEPGKSAHKPVKKAKSATKPAEKSSPTVAQKSEPVKKTATSRFRRSASNKIKGTLVAEFPKRLVVKYKSSHYRDPFKTLIDAARTQNIPVEQRIANVEGLKLVGIIESDGGSNRALFEDKEGYGYMLKSGDKVRNGYVLRVETDRVYFQIFEYGWSRTVALKMD